MVSAAAASVDPILRRELRGMTLAVARAVAIGVAVFLAINYVHLLPGLAESIVSQLGGPIEMPG